MKNILYIILLLSVSYSQTDVSGTVSGSWTLDGSPYNVVGDIDVITMLDIEPGVIVIFYDDSNIIVYGQLTANGTEENPIYFQENPPFNNNSSKIVFNNSWNGCSLTHIEFIDLGNPVSTAGVFTMEVSDISATNIEDLDFGGRDVSNITVTGKVGASTILSGSNIDGLTVIDSEAPILSMSGTTLTNATFDGISGAGLDIINVNSGGTLENINITNCSNDEGIRIVGGSGYITTMTNIDIQYNDFTYNAISIFPSGSFIVNASHVNVSHNDVNNGFYIDGTISCDVTLNYIIASHNSGNGISNYCSNLTLNHATIIMNGGDGYYSFYQNIIITNSVCYFNYCSDDPNGNDIWEGIDANPMYLDFETYELHPDSPLIDAGTGDDDLCFPPSMGTSTPDIGHNGGPGACDWDESDEPSISGCTDSTANNYNPDATIDDGTCEYDDCLEEFNEGYELGAESGDVNLDGLSNVLDIVLMVNNILNP